MQTTTPKTGYSSAVSDTATAGSIGTSDDDQRAERAYSRVDSLTPSVHETIERVASKAASALDRAQSEASDAQATAYAKFDDLINGEWAESVREEVRARPLAVVGIALLAGLVIGRLI